MQVNIFYAIHFSEGVNWFNCSRNSLATCIKNAINVKTFYLMIDLLGLYTKSIIGSKMVDKSCSRGENPGEKEALSGELACGCMPL